MRESRARKDSGRWVDGLESPKKYSGRDCSVAWSEARDCGRKMWTCERAVAMVEGGESGGSAMRSCWTSLGTEKVLSVSRMATQDSLPPRLSGRIAAAVSRYIIWVVPLPGACDAISIIGGTAGGFDLSRMAALIILSSARNPNRAGSGSCRNRIVCNICANVSSLPFFPNLVFDM